MSEWLPGRVALWGAATALVASAHVAVAAWAMRQQSEPLAGPPAAFEIELAPPEALPLPDAGGDDATPADIADSAEPVEPVESEPVETAEAEPEPTPPPDFTPPEITPLPPLDTAALMPPPDAEPLPDFVPPPIVPLPPQDFASLAPPPVMEPVMEPPTPRPERIAEARPEPEPEPKVEKPKVEKPKVEKKAEKKAERKAEPRAEAKTAASDQPRRANARQGGQQSSRQSGEGGTASRAQIQSWEGKIGPKVRAHMARTKTSGARGTLSLTVRVTVGADGRAQGQIIRGSGDARVDAALQRQASRMPRMPASPSGKGKTFDIPVTIKR